MKQFRARGWGEQRGNPLEQADPTKTITRHTLHSREVAGFKEYYRIKKKRKRNLASQLASANLVGEKT